MEVYYPHELILRYEICQMKGTFIGVSELILEKSYQFGFLRIRPLCFWSIKGKMFLIPLLHNKIFVLNHFKNFSEYPIFVHCSALCKKLTPLKLGLIDPKWKFYYAKGYNEHFCFYEIFWLSGQILDFTLWTKSTVVEFSKGQIDRIFPRSFLRPL